MFPNATKEMVKEEFINPKHLWIHPFKWDEQLEIESKNKSEIGFLHFNLNQLGNNLLKKQLGAFFTPKEYVEISTKYVRQAIERSKNEGFKDYLIIDRCAGSGNLERFFNKDELSHCILNTYDYTEWTTLKGLYEGRARLIIPPTHRHRTPNGLLLDGNALSKEFNNYLEQKLLKINLKETYIIFLENPPFRDETSTLSNRDKASRKTITYIDELMKEDILIKGAMKNELSIKFIWSAWKLYSPNEYILFSHIKYWKIYHLFDYEIYGGYITNKKKYNANYEAGIPVINWSNKSKQNKILKLDNGDIKKINRSIKTLLDKEKNSQWIAKMFIMAGDLRPIGTSLDNGKQIINDTPCFLNKNNILKQLPLWCAAKYEPRDLELNILMKSGDGDIKYTKDEKFLIDCFIWACLTSKNKCISDGDHYINEMALMQKSECDKILNLLNLDKSNLSLLEKWKEILTIIKKKDEFKFNYKYGLDQICKDINIKEWNGEMNKKKEKIMEWKYPELNEKIKDFKITLKLFYEKNIESKCKKYELIK